MLTYVAIYVIIFLIKLSAYAEKLGIGYKTAWHWWKEGKLDAYQTETGTVIVREPIDAFADIALCARVSRADQKDDLVRQLERLQTYAIAKGYTVSRIMTEVGSGLNESRPKLTALLRDGSIGVIVVEHKDRLMRFGFNYIVTLLELQGRRVEVVFPNETKEDLEADFIASITSHVCDCTGGAATSRGQSAFVSVSSRQRSMKNAYKSELDPNNKQIRAMRQHVGAVRWAYNWGLERIKQAAAKGERWPSAVDLHREVNKLKGTEALPWGYAVSKCAFQEALRNLQAAVDNWRVRKKGERKGLRMEFPKRKTRKHGLGACRFTGTIKVFDGCIQLPRIGVVRLKEHDYLPTDKRITQATIRERAGRWFVSVLVEEEAPTGDIPSVATEGMSGAVTEELIEVATETVSNKATSDVLGGNVLGVDVGIKTLATCSDGTCCANPKVLAAKIKFRTECR
ncbi:MAG: IS607 family transposase, partial [Caldilinea sp.]|nr:IS607 family transposase [Caldilinea sp.]